MHKRHVQYVSTPTPAAAPPVSGDGLLDFAIKTGYSAPSKEALDRFGDAQIQSIQIVRTPLQKALDFVLNKGSGGQFNRLKNTNDYDSFFHLTMYVTTDRGRVSLEKNAVVTIKEASARASNAEVMDVPQRPFPTINELVSKAQQHMGTRKYFLYNATHNNCQSYLWSLLEANGLGTPELHSFIVQDTKSIMQNSPFFRKLANSLTDLGAAVDPYIEMGKNYISNMPAVQLVKGISNPKKTMRRIKRGVRKFFGGDLGDGGFSRAGLMRKTKAELVEMILEMQE